MRQKRLDLLLNNVLDPIAQENFWRLKKLFESGNLGDYLEESSSEAADIPASDFLNRYMILADESITIPYGYESIVTNMQTVNGSLTVDGRNTIL